MKRFLIFLVVSLSVVYSQDTVFFKKNPTEPKLYKGIRQEGDYYFLEEMGKEFWETKVKATDIVRIGFGVKVIVVEDELNFKTIIVDSITRRVTFSQVVKMDSTTKKQLYINAKIWFVNIFRSANHVIQMDDPDLGLLIGKGYSDIFGSYVKMYFTVKVQCKEGRYRFELTDIYYKREPSTYDLNPSEQFPEQMITDEYLYKKNGERKPLMDSYRQETLLVVDRLFNSLKGQMVKSVGDKEDW